MNEIITLLVAALPLSELRGAIPLGILGFGFGSLKAFLLGVIGNILPIFPILIGLEGVSNYLSKKSYRFNHFFTWLFNRTRSKHGNHFHYWGELALFIFVAIPLPLTGAYSGALAAFVFGIPKKHAFWSIVFGVLLAGVIVTFATLVGGKVFKYLFL